MQLYANKRRKPLALQIKAVLKGGYMPRTEEIKDVPPADVQSTIDDYKSEGAINVQSIKQPNGRYTVTATFP